MAVEGVRLFVGGGSDLGDLFFGSSGAKTSGLFRTRFFVKILVPHGLMTVEIIIRAASLGCSEQV